MSREQALIELVDDVIEDLTGAGAANHMEHCVAVHNPDETCSNVNEFKRRLARILEREDD